MSYKPTAQDLENSKPGHCPKCGKFSPAPYGRDTAGQCEDCHRAGYYAYKAKRREWLEAQKQAGREYWKARGIAVGDTVTSFARSMLGIGGMTVTGRACVGAVGAYVRSKYQPGYLQPQHFKSDKERRQTA
jgi:hypothetical protein